MRGVLCIGLLALAVCAYDNDNGDTGIESNGRRLNTYNTTLEMNLCSGVGGSEGSSDTFTVDFPSMPWIAPINVVPSSSISTSVTITGSRPESIRVTAGGSDGACFASIVLGGVLAKGAFPMWLDNPCQGNYSGGFPCEVWMIFPLQESYTATFAYTTCAEQAGHPSGVVLDFPENSGSPFVTLYPPADPSKSGELTVTIASLTARSLRVSSLGPDKACFSSLTLDGMVLLSSDLWFQDTCDGSKTPCVTTQAFTIPYHYYATLTIAVCSLTDAGTSTLTPVSFPSNPETPVTHWALANVGDSYSKTIPIVGTTPPTSIKIESVSSDAVCIQAISMDGLQATGVFDQWLDTPCQFGPPCLKTQTWNFPTAHLSTLYLGLCQADDSRTTGSVTLTFPSNSGTPSISLYPLNSIKTKVVLTGGIPSSMRLTAEALDHVCIEHLALDDVDVTGGTLPLWLSSSCSQGNCGSSHTWTLPSYRIAWVAWTLCSLTDANSVDAVSISFPNNPSSRAKYFIPFTERSEPFGVVRDTPTALKLAASGQDAVCFSALTVDSLLANGSFPLWIDTNCTGDDFQGEACATEYTWTTTATTATTGGTTALRTQGTGDLPLWQVAAVIAAVVFVFIVAVAAWKFYRCCGCISSHRIVSIPKVGGGGHAGDAIEWGRNPRPHPVSLVPAFTPVDHATAEIFERMLSKAVDLKHGLDLRYKTTPPHKSIEFVDAWRVEAPFIEASYNTHKSLVRCQVDTVLGSRFPPGSHVPAVTTLLSDLQAAWPLDAACNETWLLHGTPSHKVLDILSTGLSEKFSGGLFGRGVYLAENAAKVDQYVEPLQPKGDGPGEAEIRKTLFADFGKAAPKEDTFFLLVCSVALGFPTYTKDAETAMFSPPAVSCISPGSAVFETTEKRELVKVPGVSPTVRYHSLIAETGGVVKRFREFIVFNGNGILPQYIVAYKRVL